MVKQPGLAPFIAGAEYRSKKTFLTGNNFEAGAIVYIDGEALEATLLDAATLRTQKRKQKAGTHVAYVVNPDGKQSPAFQFFVE